MAKNKKGKKKNKMAGRTRPNPETAAENGDKILLTIPSDTSETEERTDRTEITQPRTPEPDALTSDSGIDSGRGSPGDVAGSSTASGDIKITIQPQIDEERDSEEVDEDFTCEVKSAETSPKAETRSHSQVEPEDKMSEKSNETEEIRSHGEPEAGTGNETKKRSEKPDTKSDRGVRSPTATVRSKGAVSIGRHTPLEDVKHPLEFAWTFWALDFDVQWDRALSRLASFDTAEDFWWYFNTVRNPKALGKGILMFKKHVRPEWEDPRNSHGGRWNLSQGVYGRAAEDLWQELALMMIGGIKFGSLTPHLNGIYCTWKGDGIHYSIWIDTLEDETATSIGNIIHQALLSVLDVSFHMELVPCHSDRRSKKKVLRIIR